MDTCATTTITPKVVKLRAGPKSIGIYEPLNISARLRGCCRLTDKPSVLFELRHAMQNRSYYLDAETSSVSSVFIARGYLRSNAQTRYPFFHLPFFNHVAKYVHIHLRSAQIRNGSDWIRNQDWSQFWPDQDWIGLRFFWKLADRCGSDWEICCFDVNILTTSNMIVVMLFCRLVKW